MSIQIFRAIVEAAGRGDRVALVTVVATGGSTPQRVGAKMIVFEDGRTIGTIGGGSCEHESAVKAREAIATGRPALVHFTLTDDLAAENGLVCGGHMDVYLEPVAQAAPLYIAGAGHVAAEVAKLAHQVGFRVTVVDDREAFANRDRFPEGEVVVADIAGWFAAQAFPAGSYFVVVTRGHRQDLETVKALAPREWAYLGLIGSRGKVRKVFEALEAAGVARERLARLHAPVGLDLGAVTPAEIAVSIVAELIAARSGRLGAPHVAAAALRSRLTP
ncbi:MAG TPA: XdhC/CoxI family protein [Vicinamibacterales bacterium]|nr:XdhC/CoxI family protein [Vicinamibacterales bacterium]